IDSRPAEAAREAEWIDRMEENNRDAGLSADLPVVYQANKQDLAAVSTPESVARLLGRTMRGASARERKGVLETLRDLLDRIPGDLGERIDWGEFHPFSGRS